DHVDYDIDERTIEGELEKFKVTALNAHFASRDVDLGLRGGTSLALSNVTFSLGRDRVGTIDARGEIVGAITPASELNITSGIVSATSKPIASHVAFNSGSIHLVNAQIAQLASGRSVIQVGQGSTVEASLLSSSLAVGKDGMFNIRTGDVVFKLTSGRWDSD